jgi:ubiquitin-activating enzyme E1
VRLRGVLRAVSCREILGVGNQLHVAMHALFEFQDAHGGQLPALHSAADADELVAFAHRQQATAAALPADTALVVDELNVDVVRKLALYARAELPGNCAFVGGVAAQEVLKRVGKFTPLFQWMHMDHFELLDEAVPADAAPLGCRYDHQIAVFGRAIQEKIEGQRWFLVGVCHLWFFS